MPQNNHFIGVWMPGSFIEQRWVEEVREPSKKSINLASIPKGGKPQARGCVNFFLPDISRWTKRGRIL